ncbi:hypothetical protein AAFF_G00097080 [Aldrovandia affinis]|uniref:NADH dehydrogenase [ubiquinone] 1 beta subcomplex subunit 2, mitochondrial n=1 Tax=Aldrovandia affinis TaxID=143900 RepID=A0AAD7RVM0_9TELE|nr:hypothetical protein AAFF_G00097080 [Aldrovandia affinis]
MSSLGRTVGVLRAGVQLLRRGPQKMVVRKAGGGAHIEAQYRQFPQLTKNQLFQAELLSSAMWFWILWHCWHDLDAVTGHFPWPDASHLQTLCVGLLLRSAGPCLHLNEPKVFSLVHSKIKNCISVPRALCDGTS